MNERLLQAIAAATEELQQPPHLVVWEDDDGGCEVVVKWMGHFQYRVESGTATWWSEKGKKVASMFRYYLEEEDNVG